MINWEIIATILGSLGGWEAIKYFIHRKQNNRIAEAEADGVEFGVMKETIEFLQEQLKEMVEQDAAKEERFREQTNRLRETQDREYKLIAENNQLKLDLATYRCVVPKCPNREPKNNY